jgi:hypothetical protein
MSKIAAEEVVKSYIKLAEFGIKPNQGITYSKEKKCACGLAAIYLAKDTNKIKFSDDIGYYVFTEIDERFGGSYTNGFIAGFDGDTVDTSHFDNDFARGFQDGEDAWNAVVKEGLLT